jgi:hypothetical protein
MKTQQLLEIQFDKEKEERTSCLTVTKPLRRLRKPSYPMKLSEIWGLASRELKQIKIEFGDASSKEACAMGAISFYLSGRKTCHLSELDYGWQKAVFRDMVKTFESKSKSSIWVLNDLEGWTFKDFAEKALELGM